MSIRPYPALLGSEGELVLVRISVDPRYLEEALEAIAQLSFPVNPQIYHTRPSIVEFPAYRSHLDEIESVFHEVPLRDGAIQASPMLEAIAGTPC